jgi:hypothetical protein
MNHRTPGELSRVIRAARREGHRVNKYGPHPLTDTQLRSAARLLGEMVAILDCLDALQLYYHDKITWAKPEPRMPGDRDPYDPPPPDEVRHALDLQA